MSARSRIAFEYELLHALQVENMLQSLRDISINVFDFGTELLNKLSSFPWNLTNPDLTLHDTNVLMAPMLAAVRDCLL